MALLSEAAVAFQIALAELARLRNDEALWALG